MNFGTIGLTITVSTYRIHYSSGRHGCAYNMRLAKEKHVMRHAKFLMFVITILSLPLAGYAGQARAGGARGGQARAGGGAARFEVTSLRAVRPILAKAVADLEKKDV